MSGWAAPPFRPVVMWAPYRWGVFSYLQSLDAQNAATIAYLRGEIFKGVVDGSAAKPGQIGEIVNLGVGGIDIPTASNTQSVPLGTLGPGDWDCWAVGGLGMPQPDVAFHLEPLPAGFMFNVWATAEQQGEVLSNASPARLSQPTPIVMTVISNTLGAGSGTTLNLSFLARRRR